MVFADWSLSFALSTFRAIIFSAMTMASGPLHLITAIAPLPGGVEMAHIVLFALYIPGYLQNKYTCACKCTAYATKIVHGYFK
jgi:hypothetical protein